MSYNRRKITDYLWFIYLILGGGVIFWSSPQEIILSGDFGWPLFFRRFIEYTQYIWDDSVGFGYSASRQLASLYPYAIWGMGLEALGLDMGWIQKIIIYVSFVASGLGMYLLAKLLKITKEGAFFSGIVYMYSPYAMSLAWNPSIGLNFPFFCYLPLSLFFVGYFLKKKSISTAPAGLLGLVVSPLGMSYSNPVIFMVFMSMALFLLGFLCLQEPNTKKFLINRFIIFIFFYIIVNAFWLIPLVSDLHEQFLSADNGAAKLIGDQETLNLNSISLLKGMQDGSGLWIEKAEYGGEYYFDWYRKIDSLGYRLWSIILAVLAVYGLIVASVKKNTAILFVGAGWLFFLLLISASKIGVPFTFISRLLFYSSLMLRAFRNLYSKLGGMIVFFSAILVGYASADLMRRFRVKGGSLIALFLASICTICFIGSPLMNGQVIKSAGKYGIMAPYAIKIPKEYFSLQKEDSKISTDSRIITLPIPPSYNIFLKWDRSGYGGADFLRNLLHHSLIYSNDGSYIMKEIIAGGSRDQSTFLKLLGFLGVRHILVRHDLNRTRFLLDTYLLNMEEPFDLKKVIDNRYITLFELPSDYVTPHIYVSHHLNIKSDKQTTITDFLLEPLQFPATIAFSEQNLGKMNVLYAIPQLLLGKAFVEFHKVSPVRYQIHIRHADKTLLLVFGENYHSGWKVYITSQISRVFSDRFSREQHTKIKKQNLASNVLTSSQGVHFISEMHMNGIQNDNISEGWFGDTLFQDRISEQSHIVVNGYANAWLIDTKQVCRIKDRCLFHSDGTVDFDMTIQFRPQWYFYIGLILSLLGCLIMLIFWVTRVVINNSVIIKYLKKSNWRKSRCGY